MSWQRIEKAAWETQVTPCACCGQVVAAQLWVSEINGQTLGFCSPNCEELYKTYRLPKEARPS